MVSMILSRSRLKVEMKKPYISPVALNPLITIIRMFVQGVVEGLGEVNMNKEFFFFIKQREGFV